MLICHINLAPCVQIMFLVMKKVIYLHIINNKNIKLLIFSSTTETTYILIFKYRLQQCSTFFSFNPHIYIFEVLFAHTPFWNLLMGKRSKYVYIYNTLLVVQTETYCNTASIIPSLRYRLLRSPSKIVPTRVIHRSNSRPSKISHIII